MEEEIPMEPWWKGPFKYILGALLILLMVMWYFPSQAIKIDPEPRNIPSISDVVPSDLEFEHIEIYSRQEYLNLLSLNDVEIKSIADKIVTQSCDGNRICHAKAIYYFVRDNLDYVSDPNSFEYVKTAKESLVNGGGDCDDASVLAASLLEAVGINTRFVFIPGHVYIQANLPEAIKRYKSDGDMVNLDLTCKNCAFGELPYSTNYAEKTFIG